MSANPTHLSLNSSPIPLNTYTAYGLQHVCGNQVAIAEKDAGILRIHVCTIENNRTRSTHIAVPHGEISYWGNLRRGALLVGSTSGTLTLWEGDEPSTSTPVAIKSKYIRSILELRSGDLVLFGRYGYPLLLKSSSLKMINELGHLDVRKHSFRASTTVSLDEGIFTVVDESEQTIKLWSAYRDKLAGELKEHEGRVREVLFLSSRQLATTADDCTVRIWDPKKCQQVRIVYEGTAPVTSMLEFPRGTLVLGLRNGGIQTVRCKDGLLERYVAEHTSGVYCLNYLLDGGYVSGSEDGSIKVWDTHCPESRMTLQSRHKRVRKVVQIDSGALISYSLDGSVTLWSSPSPAHIPSEGEMQRVEQELCKIGLQIDNLQLFIEEKQISLDALKTTIDLIVNYHAELSALIEQHSTFAIHRQNQLNLLNHANSNVGDYYEQAWSQLTSTLLCAMVLANNRFKIGFETQFSEAQSLVNDLLASAAPLGETVAEHIPVIGFVASLLFDIFKHYDSKQKKAAIRRLASLVRNPSEIGRLAERIAFLLTREHICELEGLAEQDSPENIFGRFKQKWKTHRGEDLSPGEKRASQDVVKIVVQVTDPSTSPIKAPKKAEKIAALIFPELLTRESAEPGRLSRRELKSIQKETDALYQQAQMSDLAMGEMTAKRNPNQTEGSGGAQSLVTLSKNADGQTPADRAIHAKYNEYAKQLDYLETLAREITVKLEERSQNKTR